MLCLFVHPSWPRCCLVVLTAVCGAGAVSAYESFSIRDNWSPFAA